MKITISVPAQDVEDYVEHVLDQIRDGFTSGFVKSDTYWNSEGDDDESQSD